MRTWLVTGIGSGLGQALAEALLAQGDRVAGTGRNSAPVASLAQRYPNTLWVADLDRTEVGAIAPVADAALERFARQASRRGAAQADSAALKRKGRRIDRTKWARPQ